MENAERIRELIEAIGRTKLQSEAMKRMVAELLELVPAKMEFVALFAPKRGPVLGKLGLVGMVAGAAYNGFKLYKMAQAYRLQKQREKVWK